MRKRRLLFGVLVTGIISLSFSCLAIAGDEDKNHTCPLPVKVVIFQHCQGAPCSFSTTGSGAPYSIKFGAFRSPDVKFFVNTSFMWHPFVQATFGADISGLLKVEDTATYTFALRSDDGSQLYIDGNLVVDNGGVHGDKTVSGSTMLTKGIHSFTVQFFECCGGASGVDLTLPDGVKYISDEDCKKDED